MSFHFPRLPTSISGLDHVLIRHDIRAVDHNDAGIAVETVAQDIAIEPAPEAVEPAATATAPSNPVSVLAVATEWSSGRGGLSTFNRQLCVALARAGAKVTCLVLNAAANEIAEAEELEITLIEAGRGPGLSDEQRLLGKPTELKDASPDFLIGHGRITGPAAASLAENHYRGARRLHFVHMAPDEIEPYKLDRSDQVGARAQERTEIEEELGRTADRVVAVGPRLHGRYTTLFAGYPNVPAPIRFDPGFDAASAERRDPPGGDPWQVLLLGRAEDIDLKGLDTAALAVAMAAKDRAFGLARLELVVRGAQTETMDALRAELLKKVGVDNLSLIIRAFTVRDETLQADMRRASLVLMPSKAEGFGLVGAEAIVAGTPVLISAESGLGQLLQELLSREQAARIVVPMNGNAEQLRDRWAGNINRVLSDREASFRRAAEVRNFLASEKTWQRSVETLLEELAAG